MEIEMSASAKRLRLFLLSLLVLGFGLILIVAGVIAYFRFGPYDRFYYYDLLVSSPRTTYAIGDTIELIYEIRCKDKGKVRLYKDRSKSLHLSIHSLSGTDDIDVYQEFKHPSENDEIETFEFSADSPFQMTVKGDVIWDKDGEGIIFDFGGFGRFKKDGIGTFSIGGLWRPIHPEPSDSLEDYVEAIVIEIKNPNEANE